MINYINSKDTDIKYAMDIRLQMLEAVNGLPHGYKFSEELVENSRRYFEGDSHTTILAFDKVPVACASMCYIEMMPTFSHVRGKRAHLMNVYTSPSYRRQGIAEKMLSMLIEEARLKEVTEISLDATQKGRPLYEKLGFKSSDECMTLVL